MKIEIYACGIMVGRCKTEADPRAVIGFVFTVVALNDMDAQIQAMEIAKKMYREDEGWHSHAVQAVNANSQPLTYEAAVAVKQ